MEIRSKEWWVLNAHKSGDQLARDFGGYGGSWRRWRTQAIDSYPDINWNGVKAVCDKPLVAIEVFDLHHPLHDKKLWQNILTFTEQIQPDIFVFGGDNQDMQTLSHWVGNKRRKIEGKRVKKDYQDFERDIFNDINAVLGENTRKIFHLGNHEDWVNQYLDINPELEGYLEIENNIDLSDWEVYQYGECSELGKLHIIHGTYTNQHHAYKTAQVYGRNVVYGHAHTFQAHTMVAPLDKQSHSAISMPCACSMNPDYSKNHPNAWVSGFGVTYIQPNGNFNHYPIIAVDGAFIAPTGEYYH